MRWCAELGYLPSMPKRASRIETEQRLLAAVGEQLAATGFSKLGVNAIARKAGVNKALIYRYYDGLDGLLKAYAEAGDFWPTVEEVIGDPEAFLALPAAERYGLFFERYVSALRRRPQTVEILAWETVDRNELTVYLEDARERWSRDVGAIFARGHAEPPPYDLDAIGALLTSGIHYLLVRGRKIHTFGGVPVQGDAAWERLLRTLTSLLHALDTPAP